MPLYSNWCFNQLNVIYVLFFSSLWSHLESKLSHPFCAPLVPTKSACLDYLRYQDDTVTKKRKI